MIKLTSLVCLIIFLSGCGESGNHTPEKQKNIDTVVESKPGAVSSDTTTIQQQKSTNKYYPFELQNFNRQYSIVANIEMGDLYPKYYQFFQKNGYEGNGYCWEGHIRQILEKLDKPLLAQIDFDPEAGAFFAMAKNKESQLRFVELLSPIFSDMKQLEEWVKKADRSRVDD